MAADPTVRWYQCCYAALLRLYPDAFHERFGEGMEQTFRDLCRERRNSGRGLAGLALWVAWETTMGILREHSTGMTQMNRTVTRVALVALGLLLVPLVASRVVEGWNWGPGAFVVTYVLFFGTGMAYALIARRMGSWAYKAGVGLTLVIGFVTGWSTMVHMSESENPAYLAYFGVLAVGAAGAWLARLETRGMALTLFAMAALLAVLLVTGLAPVPATPPEEGFRLLPYLHAHGLTVAMLAGAGALFRHAAGAAK